MTAAVHVMLQVTSAMLQVNAAVDAAVDAMFGFTVHAVFDA